MFTLRNLMCFLTAYLVSSGPVGIRLCHVLCDKDCSCSSPSYDSRHLSCSFDVNHRAPVAWDTKMCTSTTCLAVSTRRGEVRCVEKNAGQSHANKDLGKNVRTQVNIDPIKLTRKSTKVTKEALKPTEKETQVTGQLLKILEKPIHVTKDHFTPTDGPEDDVKMTLKRTRRTIHVTKTSLKPTVFTIQSTKIPLQPTQDNNEPPKLTRTPTQVTNETLKLTKKHRRITNETLKLSKKHRRITNETLKLLKKHRRINNEPLKLSKKHRRITNETLKLSKKHRRINNEPNKPTIKPSKHSRRFISDLLSLYTKLYLSREWNSIYYWASIPKEGVVKIKMKYFTFLQLKGTRSRSCDLYLTVQLNRKNRNVYIRCEDCLRRKKKHVKFKLWWELLYVQFQWAKNRIFVRVMEGEQQKAFPDLNLGTPSSFTDVLVSDKSGRDYVEVAKTVDVKNTDDFFL